MRHPRLVICATVVLSFGCSDSPMTPDGPEHYVYAVPQQTADGWAVGAAGDVGLNEARLVELIDIIRSGVYAKVHGVVIVKDGQLVLEEYFSGKSFEAAIGDSIVGQLTHFDRERFAAEDIYDRQRAKTLTVDELIRNEIHAPRLVHSTRDEPLATRHPHLAPPR